ncbi:MAG: YicC/YloC family endoribonuclease [Gammaproteobacteria bacterium]
MIYSMTGFARGQSSGAYGALTWELRTVNHRYLDISLRLPEDLRALEPECRELLVKVLRRGKLDGQLRLEAATGSHAALEVDEKRARVVAEAANHVGGFLHLAAPVSALDLLRWPGVVTESRTDVDEASAAALILLDETLKTLTGMRAREGERNAGQLRERARQIGVLANEIRSGIRDISAQQHAKLRSRFDELKLSVDENRLEQELVLLLQRLDVSEELDRLDSHVIELEATLDKGEAVGRRLDFLMQEFNREANTLGSKCQDSTITKKVVEMKVLIEQMREQVQNLE